LATGTERTRPGQEALRGISTLGAIWIFLKRDLKLWTYFKINFALELTGIFSNLAIYSVIASFRPTGPFLAPYGGDYVSFVILGLAINEVLTTSLSSPYRSVMNSFWSNRLEILMMAPINLQTFILGTSAGNYFRSFFRILVYIVFGVMIFGFTLGSADYATAAIFLLLGIASCLGLGMLGASMIYFVDARGGQDPVRWVIGLVSGLVAGVYFPVQVLPTWLRWIGCGIPHTYVLDGARRALLSTHRATSAGVLPIHSLFSLNPIHTDIVILAIYSAIALPLGYLALKRGVALAKKDGRLSRWI